MTRRYDYIIVGTGSASCVLASRRDKRAANRVLRIEAGEDHAPGSEPAELLDSFAAAHNNPRCTWPGSTAAFGPRPGDARWAAAAALHPGRVIGETSSINGMVAVRSLPSDEEWAKRAAPG